MARFKIQHYDDQQKVAARIKKARTDNAWSQRQLAKKVGITAAYVSRIEKGERTPSLQILEKLAKELDVSLAHLRGLKSKTCPTCGQPL